MALPNHVFDAVLDFETAVIPHTNHTRALEAIAALHGRYRPPGYRGHLMARAMLLVGATGSGKTTVLNDYRAGYPDVTPENAAQFPEYRERIPDADVRRIVYVEAPERTTRRALVAVILESFGSKPRSSWNTSDLIGRIGFYAEELGTEMIFIDEGHHMINSRNPDSTDEVTEFIKSLLNRVKVQLVIAGLPSLLGVMSTSGRASSQLRRRLQPPVYLRPYDWRTREGRVRFMAVLQKMENNMDLPEPSGLSQHEFAKRLYVASGGEIGIVSKYLSEALRIAMKEGEQAVTLDLLAEVYESWREGESCALEILDFDAPLEDESSTTGEHVKNPFSCPAADLRELWVANQKLETKGKNGLTGGRAKGPPPIAPFGRSV